MDVCPRCSKQMRICSCCDGLIDYGITTCYNCLGIVCRKCQEKKSRFIKACTEGETDVIDEIITQVHPDCISSDYRTLLSLACEKRQPWTRDVVQRLLEAGADVDVPIYGCKPLQQVLSWPQFDVSIASMLLYSSKFGVNHQFEMGWTYLYWCETIEAAQFLIDNGLDINILNDEGQTYAQFMDDMFPESEINKLLQ